MRLKTIAAACALLGSIPAFGQTPTFTWSAYGTLGAVTTNEDRGDYLVDAFKPNGPGYTDNVSLKVDTRLGGQVVATVTPKLSAVVQVLVQQNHDDSWKPRVEWANMKYQFTDDFAVRAGRIVLPVFMVTDTRRVGYANPWVRPPVEMYSLVPVTNSDGGDLNWRTRFGAVKNNLQVTVGRSDSNFPSASGFDAGKAEARRIVGVFDSFEIGSFTGRVSYGEARLTIAAYRQLFDLYRLFGPPGEAIAEKYGVDNRRVTFTGVGGTYDPGPFFVMGEAARFDTRSVVGKKSAWYLSGGWRLGKVTPYATYARLKGESTRSDPGINPAGLPPQLAAVAIMANTALNRQLGALPQQRTASLGLRWDFASNAALKLQADRVQLGSGSYGTFGNVQPDFPLGSTVSVYSAAVDFLF